MFDFGIRKVKISKSFLFKDKSDIRSPTSEISNSLSFVNVLGV